MRFVVLGRQGAAAMSRRSCPTLTCSLCGSCCGANLARRPDDTDPVIRRRLALYEEQTLPLLSWFAAEGILRTVDGQGPVDVVARRIEGAILAGRAEDEGRWSLARLSSGPEPGSGALHATGAIDAGPGR
jgi:adenylate kinase family enzyme